MSLKLRKDTANDLRSEDRAVHDWYRFVLSYPPHLVKSYLERFGVDRNAAILDPFCGTGTTLVECKKAGISGIGLDANPMACFASRVKTNWILNPSELVKAARNIADATHHALLEQGIDDLLCFRPVEELSLHNFDSEAADLLLNGSIDPLPLHKTLVLREQIDRYRANPCYDHLRLALARSTVQAVSNLYFGPEVGVRGSKPLAPVVSPWLSIVEQMANDLAQWRSKAETMVYQADARQIGQVLQPRSIDAVITSPPYPNEKDYSRTTRLEGVLLGFINNRHDLQAMKRTLIRSNTRTVYKGDEDARWVMNNAEVNELANRIESRRIALGKMSGFERLYAQVTRLYFGGMARHLDSLRPALRPGAQLAYVLGDQASFFQVMIRTGQVFARIAEQLGYRCEGIDLFRTRTSTVTGEQLREEVVLLRWDGH